MKPSFSRWLVTSAGLGLLAPAVWFLIQVFVSDQAERGKEIGHPAERVMRLIWPSSLADGNGWH